jgi:hypothetical protein
MIYTSIEEANEMKGNQQISFFDESLGHKLME